MSTSEAMPPSFEGRRVVTFESRLSRMMADMIARYGGSPVAAPALREIPLEENFEALDFAGRLIAGEFDIVLFLTGVGTRYLAQAIETRYPRATWTAALAAVKVVVRGPKPLVPLRELKVRVDLQAPEPNTWHEVLALLDAELPVVGQRIAVQEYGKSNPELIDGLRQRGATVTQVHVYRWAFPEDTAPLRQAIAAMSGGGAEIALFTSAQQVEHLLQIAAEEGRAADLHAALTHTIVVASVGPTTSETLRAHGLPVDIEPEHPKMGHLVAAAAARWRQVEKR
jgi:uroporphyrinogen-III synthase